MRSAPLLALACCTAWTVPATNLQAAPTSQTAPATADLVRWHDGATDWPTVARTERTPIYIFAGTRLSELTRSTRRQIFGNADTAEFLNRHFVCVQVDMDEHGPLAAIIRAHLRLLGHADGLPIHLWLNPDLRVIEASPYLPPTEEWGKPSFRKIATQVRDAWLADPENCGAHIAETLAQAVDTATGSTPPPADAAAVRILLDRAAADWRANADAVNGGFGDAPKYPAPELLRFLLTRPGPDRELALRTLRFIASSALRDPLDGGFFRYSTDTAWQLPCLQKLLADQARMALAYLEADAIEADPALRDAALGALDYALARLALPAGGFAFSEDGSEQPGEAAYLWTAAELTAALGADAPAFFERHHVQPEGNLTEEQDPGARFKGRNILVSHLPATPEDVAHLAKVAALRPTRGAPLRDERAFAGPQALLLAALARAAAQVNEPRYHAAADALFHHLRTLVSDDSASVVRRLAGSTGVASPTDLATLAYAFRIYSETAKHTGAANLSATLLRKLVAENLDRAAGRFIVPPAGPQHGLLSHPAPALAEPSHAEALALLAGLDRDAASLVRAGIVDRLGREDDANPGALLLALGADPGAE